MVFVKQRDLNINRVSASLIQKITPTHQKLMDIFLSKALHQRATAGTNRYKGDVLLAKVLSEK
jgi:hypothetical protein